MKKTITEAFLPYRGTKEYNGIVRKMITWFYGGFSPVAWCAIAVSYMANEVGVLSQLGGKEQNTYQLMKNTEKAWKKTGKGTFKYAKDLKKGEVIKSGSVIFILKSDAPMVYGSKKHTTTAYKDFKYSNIGYFQALGGNQSDYIQVKLYPKRQIYAVFYPDYSDDKPSSEHPTLRKGDKGDDVKTMQEDLRKIGFANITGEEMVADGSYGRITEATVKAFQEATKLTVDGVCGKQTWKKIDELLLTPCYTTAAMTDVNLRTGPGTEYKKIGLVEEGQIVMYTTILDGWIYLPILGGWCRSKWFNL